MTAVLSPSTVARVLGLPSRPALTWADLERRVERGLPPSAASHVVSEAIPGGYPALARTLHDALVHPSMRKRKPKLLPAEVGARVERVARVTAAALETWRPDTESAQRFLGTPHPLLDDRTPLEAALTDLGARQVEDLLYAARAGLPL